MKPYFNKPRYISRETFDRLDSIEKLIAQQFVFEGRWIVKEKEGVSA